MVKITNGIDTFDVTRGAYEGIFKSQGYTVVKESKVAEKPQISHQTEDKEDITEKPISKWSSDEIKAFAKEKGIDLSKAKSTKEAREIIKDYLA